MDAVRRDELVEFLDGKLHTEPYQDYCHNGLQVPGAEWVRRVVFGLDASVQLVEEAGDCQMIVVHHGLIWGRIDHIDEALARRLRPFFQKGISLYASHLPLDGASFGNAASLLRILGLEPSEPLREKGQAVGWIAELSEPIELDELLIRLRAKVSEEFQCLRFGPAVLRRIGVVTGAAARMVEMSPALGLDLFLSGESSHPTYHYCREGNLNLITAGHYNTEVHGLLSLKELVEKEFGRLETAFVDLPTGI